MAISTDQIKTQIGKGERASNQATKRKERIGKGSREKGERRMRKGAEQLFCKPHN